jgi:hypothetical protein
LGIGTGLDAARPEEVSMSVADTLVLPSQPESHHEHDWRLVAVDYDEFTEVSELQCAGCRATLFV